MRRTTIMVPDELDVRLRSEARRRGVPIADVARQALEAYLPPGPHGGTMQFFAIGDGKPDDVSERVDEFVGKAVQRRQQH